MSEPRARRAAPAKGSPGHHHTDHRRMHEAVWTREQALAVLEDPSRLASEDPRALWKRCGLRRGMKVVDVGAGSGYYALPASDLVGPKGRVYAVDRSVELVDLIRERAQQQHRTNLEVVLSRAERIPLADSIADRVLLANVLHGISASTVAEAVRLVAPRGQLINVDWKRASTAGGPPIEHRLSAATARDLLERYGLRGRSVSEFGPSHYAVILEKPAPSSRT
ncbi:MAG: class I SAM-dependent methyltransferase [Thermoplasmata archaeon]|nr:class I SAM-dependent methyltransferase [Thermoplasmata archaeon]